MASIRRGTALSLLGFFTSRARCDTSADLSFLFPSVSDASNPNIFDQTIGSNDTMVVEWTVDPNTPAIKLAMQCYASVEDAVSNQTARHDESYYAVGPYNNTGFVKYDFALLNPTSTYYGTPENDYCYFSLINTTMETCSWGPWGLTAGTYNENFSFPFLYSPVFNFATVNGSQTPRLWIDEKNKGDPAFANVTAPTTIIPCPTMGLPPAGTDITTTVDNWPPMKTGLAFPTQTYEYQGNSEL